MHGEADGSGSRCGGCDVPAPAEGSTWSTPGLVRRVGETFQAPTRGASMRVAPGTWEGPGAGTRSPVGTDRMRGPGGLKITHDPKGAHVSSTTHHRHVNAALSVTAVRAGSSGHRCEPSAVRQASHAPIVQLCQHQARHDQDLRLHPPWGARKRGDRHRPGRARPATGRCCRSGPRRPRIVGDRFGAHITRAASVGRASYANLRSPPAAQFSCFVFAMAEPCVQAVGTRST